MLEDIIEKNLDEFSYNVIVSTMAHIFSPFEVCEDVDFPKKDELGGTILKFIGSGSAYVKIQSAMPTKEEVQGIYEVGKFLEKSFGKYVVICVVCMPDVEIQDIEAVYDDNISSDFISVRKSDGDSTLSHLMAKIENNHPFTITDHVLKVIVPFMGRKNNEEFEEKYLKFIFLYNKKYNKSPDVSSLVKSGVCSRNFLIPSNYEFIVTDIQFI